MSRYSIERREWVLRQMMPPANRTVSELAEETGITTVPLYTWRKQARAAGAVVPRDGKRPDGWSSQEKFRVVLESAALNETELGEYFRRKGLYVEQIREWRAACEQAEAAALLLLRKKPRRLGAKARTNGKPSGSPRDDGID